MQSLRSIALAAGGVAILASAAVFTLSLTVLAGGILTMSLIARMLMNRAKTSPVYARAKRPQEKTMRVWNDGRGTIIDL